MSTSTYGSASPSLSPKLERSPFWVHFDFWATRVDGKVPLRHQDIANNYQIEEELHGHARLRGTSSSPSEQWK